MRTRDQGRARRRRRGGALLEFALTTPILLYLLVGVADFARYYTEAAQAGGVAWDAAQRSAAGEGRGGLGDSALGMEVAPGMEVALETFCECPFEPGVRVECTEPVCGDYGLPARYSLATVERPFEFLGRYPGFPRESRIRRTAGIRTR